MSSMYRKKPVIIEAFKWTGGPDQEDEPTWIVDALRKQWGTEGAARIRYPSTADAAYLGERPVMEIHTLEGVHSANLGDYIVQGIKGELYPCKPDIFAATYEDATTSKPTPLPGEVAVLVDWLLHEADEGSFSFATIRNIAKVITAQATALAERDKRIESLESIEKAYHVDRCRERDRAERAEATLAQEVIDHAQTTRCMAEQITELQATLQRIMEDSRGRCQCCDHGEKFLDDGTDACTDCPGVDDPKNWAPRKGWGIKTASIELMPKTGGEV